MAKIAASLLQVDYFHPFFSDPVIRITYFVFSKKQVNVIKCERYVNYKSDMNDIFDSHVSVLCIPLKTDVRLLLRFLIT